MRRIARRPLVVVLALTLGVFTTLRPPPVAAEEQSINDFRMRLYDFAGAVDSLSQGQATSVQQEILAAEPDVIVFLRDELAQRPAWDQVDPVISAIVTERAAVAGELDICTEVAAGHSPPLTCPLTAPPPLCPSVLYTVPQTVALRAVVQAFQGVAIVAQGLCDINPNTFNLITKAVVAVACTAAGVAEAVANGTEIALGINDICGGGEKEAEIQRSILASLVSTQGRIDRLSEQASGMQVILDRETDITLRSGPNLVSLQLPARVVDCPPANTCVTSSSYSVCGRRLDRSCECSTQADPSAVGRACGHYLDCAVPRKICALTCSTDDDCGDITQPVRCSVLPFSRTRICDDPAEVGFGRATVCEDNSDCQPSEVCIDVEVGGQLDMVVDLVRQRLTMASAAGLGNVPGAVADFHTARARICNHQYKRAFAALASAYTKMTND